MPRLKKKCWLPHPPSPRFPNSRGSNRSDNFRDEERRRSAFSDVLAASWTCLAFDNQYYWIWHTRLSDHPWLDFRDYRTRTIIQSHPPTLATNLPLLGSDHLVPKRRIVSKACKGMPVGTQLTERGGGGDRQVSMVTSSYSEDKVKL